MSFFHPATVSILYNSVVLALIISVIIINVCIIVPFTLPPVYSESDPIYISEYPFKAV